MMSQEEKRKSKKVLGDLRTKKEVKNRNEKGCNKWHRVEMEQGREEISRNYDKKVTGTSGNGNTMTEMAKKMEWNTEKQAVNKHDVKAINLTRKTKRIEQSKNIIKVETWNLRGTNGVDKLKQLNEVAKKYGVDIMALQELKQRGNNTVEIGNYVIISTRATFTRALTAFNEEIRQEEPIIGEVQVTFQILETRSFELDAINTKICEVMVELTAEKEDHERIIEDEYEVAAEYTSKYLRAKIEVTKLNRASQPEQTPQIYQQITAGDNADSKRRFKLPKIELKKFSEDLKDWLQFWSQFKNIH
ncbi:hypothetical protein ILUMI_16511 [Ignelater luminosus]|uniref:Uncharacterized protein n=1 Tax=Ignelater luminosus TaxID=2038154 RepID=A0A8K0G5W9_IGNLU|nr:hypothetical protein ILUMI_16511 [Ignelater luminosus]